MGLRRQFQRKDKGPCRQRPAGEGSLIAGPEGGGLLNPINHIHIQPVEQGPAHLQQQPARGGAVIVQHEPDPPDCRGIARAQHRLPGTPPPFSRQGERLRRRQATRWVLQHCGLRRQILVNRRRDGHDTERRTAADQEQPCASQKSGQPVGGHHAALAKDSGPHHSSPVKACGRNVRK